jgi:hypothetical protein
LNIKSLISIVLLMAFKTTLDYSYVNYVHIVYPEFPLFITTSKVIESYILTFVLGVIVIKLFNELKKPSYIVIYVLLLTFFIPLLSFFSLADASRPFLYLSLGGFLITLGFVKYSKPLKFSPLFEARSLLTFSIIAVTTIVFLNLLVGGGLSRISFDLLKVYEVREQYLSNTGFMMGYFLPWSAYSINTFLIAFFLYKNNKTGLIFVIFFQVFLYATTGFKSYLFAPLLIFVIHIGLNKWKVRKLLPFLTFGFIVVVVYAHLRYVLADDILTASIFTRRNFFSPAQISFLYYEFFSVNPFVYLSDSLFKLFIDNPYGTIIPVRYIVSEYFYGRQFGLNVGFIGNAFMNFGYFGIFLFSALLGLVLKTIDGISTDIPISVTVSSIIIPSMAFVNSGFLTVLLTHGFLISCLLIWLLNSSEIIRRNQLG